MKGRTFPELVRRALHALQELALDEVLVVLDRDLGVVEVRRHALLGGGQHAGGLLHGALHVLRLVGLRSMDLEGVVAEVLGHDVMDHLTEVQHPVAVVVHGLKQTMQVVVCDDQPKDAHAALKLRLRDAPARTLEQPVRFPVLVFRPASALQNFHVDHTHEVLDVDFMIVQLLRNTQRQRRVSDINHGAGHCQRWPHRHLLHLRCLHEGHGVRDVGALVLLRAVHGEAVVVVVIGHHVANHLVEGDDAAVVVVVAAKQLAQIGISDDQAQVRHALLKQFHRNLPVGTSKEPISWCTRCRTTRAA